TRSRVTPTTPPSHSRDDTTIAMAIQATPPAIRTRSSSACTWPRSRGCWTNSCCTAALWRPAARTHSRTLRAWIPTAASIAEIGQPKLTNVIDLDHQSHGRVAAMEHAAGVRAKCLATEGAAVAPPPLTVPNHVALADLPSCETGHVRAED